MLRSLPQFRAYLKPPPTTKPSSNLLDGATCRFQLDRADRSAISLIAVLAAVPRLLLLASLPPILHLDSDSYFEIAQRLWGGEGLGDLSRRTPLYPLLLWLAGRSPSAGLFPVVLLQHLLGMGGAVLSYLIARRLFFPRHRLIAAASGFVTGMVVYPALLDQSILSESLYSFLLLAAAYLLLAWFQDDRDWAALGCGALLGLAALTRPIAAGIFPLWAGLLFLLRGPRKATRFLLFGGSALLALLFPLLLRNYRVMGSFALAESLGRNLISVTDRLVDYDRGIHLPVKSIYREFLNEKRGADAVVIYSAMPRLRRATHWSDARIDRALAEIAWEAIRAHPLVYLSGRLRRLPLLFLDPGSSQWYALHAETYLPLLEFVGRFDPELVSRSLHPGTSEGAGDPGLAVPGVARIRFGLAGRVYQVFALDLTSGWLIVFPLLGIAGVLCLERRGPGWLWVALLAYLWVGSILVQPPNARYRIPTLPLEILFAMAGYYFAGQSLAGMARRAWRSKSSWPGGFKTPKAVPNASPKVAKNQRIITLLFHSWPPAFSRMAGQSTPVVVVGVILAIFAARALLGIQVEPIFNVSDWKRNWRPSEAGQAGENQPLQIRELPVAGRNLTVLYWNGGSGSVSETISANVPIVGGLSYWMQAAYSCQARECAGALLQVTFLDAGGAALDSARTGLYRYLAQERADNDLFWEQMEQRLDTPAMARTAQLELLLAGGKGSLVIPYLSLKPSPTLLSVWRMGIRGTVTFGALWLGLLFGAGLYIAEGIAGTARGDRLADKLQE